MKTKGLTSIHTLIDIIGNRMNFQLVEALEKQVSSFAKAGKIQTHYRRDYF